MAQLSQKMGKFRATTILCKAKILVFEGCLSKLGKLVHKPHPSALMHTQSSFYKRTLNAVATRSVTVQLYYKHHQLNIPPLVRTNSDGHANSLAQQTLRPDFLL